MKKNKDKMNGGENCISRGGVCIGFEKLPKRKRMALIIRNNIDKQIIPVAYFISKDHEEFFLGVWQGIFDGLEKGPCAQAEGE